MISSIKKEVIKKEVIKFQKLYAVAIIVIDKVPALCVTDKYKIHIFYLKELTFWKTITDKDPNSDFISIAIDSKNNIVVSDRHNSCIKIFFVNKVIPTIEYKNEKLSSPHGIIFDKEENLIIANKGESNILILNYKHENIFKIKLSVKYAICTFNQPISILIDASGNIIYNTVEGLGQVNSYFKEGSCKKIEELKDVELWKSKEVKVS